MYTRMISKEIDTLLGTIESYEYPSYLSANEHEPKLSVGNIVSRAAKYYEKARYSVEYKEEHLLRRTAIERILRRRLIITFVPEKSGRSFLTELIQAGYLPNDELPERLIPPVEAIINKTVIFISLLERTYPEERYSEYRSLAIKLATSEIDELIFPSVVDKAVLRAFYRTTKNHITITNTKKSIEEINIQTYIACRRGLLKDDDTVLFYQLWLMHYPQWTELNVSTEIADQELGEIAKEFGSVQDAINEQLQSQINKRIIPKLQNDIVYFSVIRLIVSQYGTMSREIFEDPERLLFAVKETTQREYDKVQQKMTKTAWRAIIYILITKTVLALSVELPYDLLVLGEIHHVALVTNIFFHPILLFLITTNITAPGAENTAQIVRGVSAIAYENGHEDIFLAEHKKQAAWQVVAGTIYFSLFIITFGSILWFLREIMHFNVAGMFFFVFFLTFVSYFGLRIRYIARRWIVHTGKEGFLSFLWDLFTLPIISLGRWLSLKFQSINIFVFIMDFIIEAPFKVVLQAIDTFALFIKEKKDEIY
jgi:hypothetical protein